MSESAREVVVPADLAAALAYDAEAAAAFGALPSSHRRKYVDWIDEAKRPATRERRVAGTIDRLKAGPARS